MSSTADQEVLSRLVNKIDSRYFGKYRGIVTDNNDPDNLGRVKAKVQRLLNDEETGWALPAFIYGGTSEQGLFAVPDINAGVWIEFEGGDLSYPIWTGTWYTSGSIPESAKPGQKVFKTQSGHKMIFDDDAGTLEITDSNGNSIKMDSSQITVSAGSATTIVIDAPEIDLVDGANHPLVFGDDLLQYLNQIVQMFNNHMHPGEATAPGGGPVTPQLPAPTMSPPSSSLLSMKVNTG
jgi:phage baseplate assembly protein gpV